MSWAIPRWCVGEKAGLSVLNIYGCGAAVLPTPHPGAPRCLAVRPVRVGPCVFQPCIAWCGSVPVPCTIVSPVDNMIVEPPVRYPASPQTIHCVRSAAPHR